jgi:hypothetical protein
MIPRLPSWPTTLLSPCFGREPKIRVATQLLKIIPQLKRYFWQKLKLETTQNVSTTTIDKQVCSLVLEVGITTVAISNHMVMI